MNFDTQFVFFLLLGLLLALLACIYMFKGLFQRASAPVTDHEALNIEIARTELANLKDARQSGQLSEEDFQQAKDNIEAGLANSLGSQVSSSSDGGKPGGRWIAWLFIPCLLALSVWMYIRVGDMRSFDDDFMAQMSPESADARNAAAGSAANSANGENGEKLPSVEELLPRLEAHLETQPDDARGWRLLGNTYLRLRRFKDAQSALGRALELMPDDAGLMLQLADASAMLENGLITGDAVALIDRALKIEPTNVQGNWLRGLASQQVGNTAEAVVAWKKILPQLQNDPESRSRLQQMIAEAQGGSVDVESVAGASGNDVANNELAADQPDTGADQAAVDLASRPQVVVEVSIAAELANNVPPDTPVFVYARASSGPPMPLAVARLTLSDLPTTVALDDALAMMPALKISSFPEVTVGARLALSGNPIAQTGDIYSEREAVQVAPDARVQVHMDQEFSQTR